MFRIPVIRTSLAFVVLALLSPGSGQAVDITPFYTYNQSPVVQIFGLPPADSAFTIPSGRVGALLAFDMANDFGLDTSHAEDITLDGETYRTTLALRYGFGKGFEAGLDIPFLFMCGGFMDSLIRGFHSAFGLGQDGRDRAPWNRLLFAYTDHNGTQRFSIDHSNGGIGDIRLSGGAQLARGEGDTPWGIALRASIKFPTGDSSHLRGSGSYDGALSLHGSADARFLLGHWTFFGSVGELFMNTGDVLPDKQLHAVTFGTLGLGWHATEQLGLKTQFTVNTPFYEHSDLRELSTTSVQWLIGGTFAFTKATSLDIGAAEDLPVNFTSPDFGIHLALRTFF